MAGPPACGRGLVARARPRPISTLAERDNRGAQRLADDRPRAGARARPTPPTPGSRRPAPTGRAAVDALHPLLGVPVALKDLVSVKGGQCTAGSRILEGYRAPYDAHITERLRDAGAVILGKTNMDEFAMGSSTEHSRVRPDRQPVGPRPRAGRQQRRVGGGRGRVPRARWRSARTPAARSASRPRCAASSG